MFEFASTKNQKQINAVSPVVRNKELPAFSLCQNQNALLQTVHSFFYSSSLRYFFLFTWKTYVEKNERKTIIKENIRHTS